MNDIEIITAEHAWNMTIETCAPIINKINSKILEAVKGHKFSIKYYWKEDPECAMLSNFDVRECIEEYYTFNGFTIYIDTYLERNCIDISWKKH